VAYPYLFAEDGPALVTTCLLAVNLAERAGAIQAAARSYGQLGYLAGVFHARPLAARYFARARASAAAARDPGELAIARYHEAIYHLCDGAWAEAHAAGEGALAALSDLRSPNEAEIVETILAHVDYGAGRYDDSIARCDRILESARERANEQHAAWGHYTGARSLLRRGRVGEAIGKLESARVLLRAQADQASEIICTGLSALAFQRAGDLHAAERAADACLSRIGAGLPTVWSVGDGYAGAAEAYLDLWAATARAPQDPSLAARLRRAWAAQLRFAVVFGIGRPAFWITTGRVLGLGGARRAARWALSRALQESEVRAMPYEAAVASLRLAALGPVGSPERARDLDRAHRGFTALGCAHELGAVERAAQERR
jgi:tetratricopeptide (TPR) repeat protein